MNDEEFEVAGHQMLKYVIDYHKKIRERRVMPNVRPGFMRKLLPDHAPQTPEKWDQLYKDIERVIMPGVSIYLLYLNLFWTRPTDELTY